MKTVVFGFLVCAGLFLVAAVATKTPESVFAQPAAPRTGIANAELKTLALPMTEGYHQLLVIDPQTRAICVYHVNGKTGEIALKSIRNIQWDLQVSEYNAVNPLPHEIRSLLQQR